MRFATWLSSNRGWSLLVIAMTAVSLLLAFAPALQAAPGQPTLSQQQVFNDDLTVRQGEVIDGDVVVYQGDVVVARGGVIRGNLVVYSGSVEVDEGGRVVGDVTAFSGDVEIDGAVEGSITAWSGDVDLGRSAVVNGDVSVVSGKIEQDRGAVVEGSLLRGPSVGLPALPPQVGALPGLPAAPLPAPPPSPAEIFWNVLQRVVSALLILGVTILVALLLLKWRPALVEEMRSLLVERTALAFAVGLIFNLFGLALIGLLWITFCFRPPALLLGVLLIAVNLVGVVIVGDELGRRLAVRLGAPWVQPWRSAIGIAVPGAVIAFLWILGSCFGFLAFLGALILSALGVGVILIKLLKLGAAQPPAPTTTAPAPVAPESSPEVKAAAPAEVAPATTVLEVAPQGEVAPQAEAAADVPPAPPAEVAAATTVEEVAPQVEAAADVPPAPPAPVEPALTREDDFTRINGIGPVFEQRLKAAGIRTYAELAARTSAEIAEIVKWPEARVERAAIVEQAQRLAQGDA